MATLELLAKRFDALEKLLNERITKVDSDGIVKLNAMASQAQGFNRRLKELAGDLKQQQMVGSYQRMQAELKAAGLDNLAPEVALAKLLAARGQSTAQAPAPQTSPFE